MNHGVPSAILFLPSIRTPSDTYKAQAATPSITAMTSGTMVAIAAAPVNTGMLLVRVALPEPVPVALREAVMEALPEALLGLTLPVDEAMTVPLPALEEARKPLQRPLLQVL